MFILYVAGIAFVAAVFQGNLGLALAIAICCVTAYAIGKIFSNSSRASALANCTSATLSRLGNGWVAIRLKRDEFQDPVALIYRPGDRAAILLIGSSYGGSDFRTEDKGQVIDVKLEELRPAEIIQPNARLRIIFSTSSQKFIISGEKNWRLLQMCFPNLGN